MIYLFWAQEMKYGEREREKMKKGPVIVQERSDNDEKRRTSYGCSSVLVFLLAGESTCHSLLTATSPGVSAPSTTPTPPQSQKAHTHMKVKECPQCPPINDPRVDFAHGLEAAEGVDVRSRCTRMTARDHLDIADSDKSRDDYFGVAVG